MSNYLFHVSQLLLPQPDFDRAVKLLEIKLAMKNMNSVDSLGSNRLTINVMKNGRSPSIGNLSPVASPVVVPSATISRFSGVATAPGGGGGSQDGGSNFVLSLAAAVAGAMLNKIEESEDGSEEVEAAPEENLDDGRVRTPPIMRRLNARLTSGSYSSLPVKPALTRSGSVSSSMSKDANPLAGGASSSGGYSAAFYKEVEEQLADTLFKRAQAKLMIETSAVNVEAALSDAIKASAYMSEDDDYQMIIATCYIRLNRFEDALRVLQHILDRSPNNFKALYNYSFCQRASGQQKNAIEGLTKACQILKFLFQFMVMLFLCADHLVFSVADAVHDIGRAVNSNPPRL
jgi:tetratricopeptide (TPR) repeat protein